MTRREFDVIRKSHEVDGVFLPVDANDIRADEIGDTFVEDRFESR